MFLILILGLCVCAVQAVEPIVSLLATNVATCRDEMFHFRVSFSDVQLGTDEFRFVQTMFHKEVEGSFKVTTKYALPLKLLKSSTREVLTNEGIGKNTLVRIKLPKNTPSTALTGTTETINSEGKRTVETITIENSGVKTDGELHYNCDIYFPNSKAATEWNDKLSELLKS